MKHSKLLLGIVGVAVGLVVGLVVGDRYGLPLQGSGVESNAQLVTPSGTGRACGSGTEIGFYWDGDGNRYIGCRDRRGRVTLISYPE